MHNKLILFHKLINKTRRCQQFLALFNVNLQITFVNFMLIFGTMQNKILSFSHIFV